jgi:hypothetical protein
MHKEFLRIARELVLKVNYRVIYEESVIAYYIKHENIMQPEDKVSVGIQEYVTDRILKEVKKKMLSKGFTNKKIMRDSLMIIKSELMSRMFTALNFHKND